MIGAVGCQSGVFSWWAKSASPVANQQLPVPDFSTNNMQNNFCIIQSAEQILFTERVQSFELPLRAGGWGQYEKSL